MSYIEDNGYFVFDGVKSSDYGVWINGGGTFNAPARRYKEYVVPGRNGTLTIDEGAFEDAEVVYSAFIARDFSSNIEAFRNELMARNGYVRMTDSYHPDEYYKAKYMSGLEANVLPWGRAGSFDLMFKRDPRRFLISGETPITYPPGKFGKNLLKYPYANTTKEEGGILFTDVGDGTIIVSGQRNNASGQYLTLESGTMLTPILENGETYILSGCPAGGGFNYYIYLFAESSSNYDRGEGAEFTFDSTKNHTISIQIVTRDPIENLVFKPMIRKASDPDDAWVPFFDGSAAIQNPTLFSSNPLIRVTGSGTVTIGDESIAVSSGYNYVDINSEIQDCYCGTQNANSVVTFQNGKFPQLKPGISGIASTGVTSVQITPNWYRL